MGHPQPPTPIMTDNSTASGIVNSSIKQHWSRAIDMRFYWVKDRVQQGYFSLFGNQVWLTWLIIKPSTTLALIIRPWDQFF
eukprot:8197854-Ditylum_brightwellii.AAC.1